MTQVIAIDWSGRAKGSAEAIRLARVVDRRLVELENGLGRAETVAAMIRRGLEVWRDVSDRAEQLLADCRPPLWGRAGTSAQTLGDPYRDTDTAVDWPRVVEIYPRVFAPGVVKGRHRSRREHLERRFPEQDPVLRERAAGSEDGFDAAVSALVMAHRVAELERRPEVPPGSTERIEGAIWTPRPAGSGAASVDERHGGRSFLIGQPGGTP